MMLVKSGRCYHGLQRAHLLCEASALIRVRTIPCCLSKAFHGNYSTKGGSVTFRKACTPRSLQSLWHNFALRCAVLSAPAP